MIGLLLLFLQVNIFLWLSKNVNNWFLSESDSIDSTGVARGIHVHLKTFNYGLAISEGNGKTAPLQCESVDMLKLLLKIVLLTMFRSRKIKSEAWPGMIFYKTNALFSSWDENLSEINTLITFIYNCMALRYFCNPVLWASLWGPGSPIWQDRLWHLSKTGK